jgi:hypothetical protein
MLLIMKLHRIPPWMLAAVALLANTFATHATTLSPEEVEQIGEDAYIYGYSLITTEVTRVQMTNVPEVHGMHGPMGQFMNILRYPPADFRGVSAPNADTLYSPAWIDLGKEPTVFTYPDMGKRYFLFPTYSLWMPVAESLGSRTTGQGAGKYLITGPGWDGEVPEGLKQIKSPTRYFLILGRTYSDGSEEDYKAVNALQAQYNLVPLSAYGKPYTFVAPKVDEKPGFSMTDKPQDVILRMSTSEYFNRMTTLMGDVAPPAPEDAPIVAEMAKIGLIPGQPFDITKLDPTVQAALTNLPKNALAKIVAQATAGKSLVNGWAISGLQTGYYGTNYLGRALIAAVGWPANLPQDAVYPTTFVDAEGKKLDGANKYTLTFPKGQTPPADGFWSITMYFDDGGWWFYPNPLNKFTVSLRDKPKFNEDDSLTLYFQHESPGAEKEANWLPSPAGDFLLTLRMYWPKDKPPSILPLGKGTWVPPAVVKVN